MLNRNQLILLFITLVTLILSGYLFYSGINYQKSFFREEQEIPFSNTSPNPEESPQVLGSESEEDFLGDIYQEARVTKVVDGDTIEVEINGQRYKLRYIGVNTPETVDPRKPVECFGREASDENKRVVFGKTVFLEKDISETDKFGRLLRYVYLKLDDDSLLFINDYLVRQGYAYASDYPPDVKYTEKFQEAQKQAEENQRGLWASCK